MKFGASIFAAACLAACALGPSRAAWADPRPVTIDGKRIFPESLDVAADGTIYVGSIGQSAVYRALPGSDKATLFISKAKGGLSAVLGVVTDEPHGLLWICSSDLNRLGEPVSLKKFDIKTGELKGDYPFIQHKGVCNDIAIAPDGTAYATDTGNARIYRLRPAASALEIWISDPRFDGVDGVAFGKDGQMYINSVRTGRIFRIAMNKDGSAGAVTPIATSRPLQGPDGMRLTADGRFAIAENAGGRVSLGTLSGDTMQIQTLKEGLDTPPGVAPHDGTIWAIQMKQKYRKDPALLNTDAGPFVITPIAIPKKGS